MPYDERERRPDSAREPTKGLPLRASVRTHERIIIAHHLVLHGYGHWLPNDPRGSGSDELRQEKLAPLGPIHTGRKRVQPPRAALRRFYREAEPLLEFPTLWFDDAKRQAIGEAFAQVVAQRRYTVWACAILRNHAHLCIRRHRDDADAMWKYLAEASRAALCARADVPADHPVWSARPYKVFLYTPDDVRRVIAYIEANPLKERVSVTEWGFVRTYDGWPNACRPRERRINRDYLHE